MLQRLEPPSRVMTAWDSYIRTSSVKRQEGPTQGPHPCACRFAHSVGEEDRRKGRNTEITSRRHVRQRQPAERTHRSSNDWDPPRMHPQDPFLSSFGELEGQAQTQKMRGSREFSCYEKDTQAHEMVHGRRPNPSDHRYQRYGILLRAATWTLEGQKCKGDSDSKQNRRDEPRNSKDGQNVENQDHPSGTIRSREHPSTIREQEEAPNLDHRRSWRLHEQTQITSTCLVRYIRAEMMKRRIRTIKRAIQENQETLETIKEIIAGLTDEDKRTQVGQFPPRLKDAETMGADVDQDLNLNSTDEQTISIMREPMEVISRRELDCRKRAYQRNHSRHSRNPALP